MTETASALVKPDKLGNPEFLLTTNVASLRSALQLTVFPRPHIPVLSMIRFQDGEITATDLDVCIKAKVPAMEAYGAALAPHRELQAIANSLRADTQITLRSRKGGVALSFDGGSYFLPSMDVSEFPEFSFKAERSYADIPKKFTQALRFALPAVSTEETRYYLNGVCLSEDTHGVPVAVGTNGHILAAHPHGVFGKELVGRIIPSATAKRVANLPSPDRIELSNNERIAFHYSGISILSRLIDGTFPDWKRLPHALTDKHAPVSVDSKTFVASVRRMKGALSLVGNHTFIHLITTDGMLHLAGTNHEHYEAVERVPVLEGSAVLDFKPSYATDYLIKVGQLVQGDKLTLHIPSDVDTAIVTGEADGFYLLMPSRVDAKFAEKVRQQLVAGNLSGEAA